MKVSYNWLKEHIALELAPEELAKKLTALGFEVAAIDKKGPQFKGVVTAKVLEVTKHPNADRLRLCVVDDGATKLSIVCGAPNVAAGLTVPLARIGAELPGGKKLTPAKIRGVESQGMLCSGAELGLASDAAGIMVLPETTPIGKDFAQLLGPGDAVMEVEITPNRPDCLSHRGLARELAAYLGLKLKSPSTPQLQAESGDAPKIAIESLDACPLYFGRLITGVKVGPSPAWLCAKLEAVGLRPINNVVDVTNYILMDIGQPLHVFDASRLSGPEINVRWARSGESIKALDGKTYELSGDSLVIADKDKPVAIAGVMGGEETGATEKTTTVLLEAAYFAPAVIRKSGQKLRLKSDSSYRFERGVDPGAVEEASRRAAALIAQLGGKDAKVSAAKNPGVPPMAPKPIEFTAARINDILGGSFTDKQIETALDGIAKVQKVGGEKLRFSPPTFRGDMESVWDLAEEVARLLGYDQVPSKAAPIALKPAKLTAYEALAERCKDRLAALGLFEAYNYDFVSAKALERAGLPVEGWPRLANPLSDDWTILRPTLLLGLLDNAARNLNRGAVSVRLFELGSQYKLAGKEAEERRHAAGLMLGPVADRFWQAARTPDAGFYDIKGLVEDLLSGLPSLSWTPLKDAKTKTGNDSFFHPAAALRVDGPRGALGAVGLLHPTLAREWGLDRQPVALFDLDLEQLVELESPAARYQPYSQFPVSRRDLSLVVDRAVPYARLEETARKGAGDSLQSVELVDVFAGKGIPEGKHSLLLRLTFGRMDRTLMDSEVAQAVEAALAGLKALGAELRA